MIVDRPWMKFGRARRAGEDEGLQIGEGRLGEGVHAREHYPFTDDLKGLSRTMLVGDVSVQELTAKEAACQVWYSPKRVVSRPLTRKECGVFVALKAANRVIPPEFRATQFLLLGECGNAILDPSQCSDPSEPRYPAI